MHTRSLLVGAVAAGVVASTCFAARAAAQGPVSPQCQSQLFVAIDACQKALDLFNFMAPQLGVSMTGGNAVIGSASTLGGLGHVSFGVRANIVRGQLPQTDNVQLNLTTAARSNFNPKDQILGLPTADAAIGLFQGVNVGLTNVGGVDALFSAFYVPDINKDPVSVSTTGGRVRFGYGARLGVLQETSFVPGVSLSVLQRSLPTTDLRARIGTSDSVRVTSLKEKTTAWRLAASKSFLLLGVTAGLGQDRYDASADAGAFVAPRQFGPVVASFSGAVAHPTQKLTRTNVFAGASLHFSLVRLAAEVGRVSGGSVPSTFNDFGGAAESSATRTARPYTYGSVGLRVGF